MSDEYDDSYSSLEDFNSNAGMTIFALGIRKKEDQYPEKPFQMILLADDKNGKGVFLDNFKRD